MTKLNYTMRTPYGEHDYVFNAEGFKPYYTVKGLQFVIKSCFDNENINCRSISFDKGKNFFPLKNFLNLDPRKVI